MVANAGWLIITKDKMIQKRPAEIAAVRDNAARMVALSGSKANSLWGQLELVVPNWSRLEAMAVETGPFISRVTSSRVTRLEIGP